jgi:streptogramin lyase
MDGNWLRIVLSAGIVAGLAVTVPPAPPASAATPPPYVTKWGSYGAENGQFYSPKGLTVDGHGDVYVADDFNDRIQKFTTNGGFVTKWGAGHGSADGQFIGPYDVVVGPLNSFVNVADHGNHRVQAFGQNGSFMLKWGGWPAMNAPSSLAVDQYGNVYVLNTGKNEVQKFGSGGNSITKWGSSGGGDAQFYVPYGIAVDKDGYVYVADTGNQRIQKFDSNGNFVTKWGTGGSGDGQFKDPHGVAVDTAGHVFVADSTNHRIQEFDSNGGFLTTWGSYGQGNGQFFEPWDVAVDTAGNVFVSDTRNNRIQKFGTGGSAGGLVDARIRPADGGAWTGNGVYNTSGAGQTVSGSANRGRIVAFTISIQNDGSGADSFTVEGSGSTSLFRVWYLHDGADVTPAVLSGTYTTPALARGRSDEITVRVKVQPIAPKGSSIHRLVTARSVARPSNRDVVGFIARRRR